jgi:hypothetical protein
MRTHFFPTPSSAVRLSLREPPGRKSYSDMVVRGQARSGSAGPSVSRAPANCLGKAAAAIWDRKRRAGNHLTSEHPPVDLTSTSEPSVWIHNPWPCSLRYNSSRQFHQ